MSRARSTAADGEPGADRVRSTRALNIAAIDLIYAAIIAIRTGASRKEAKHGSARRTDEKPEADRRARIRST
ncbi:hypothetical protein VTN49DRAFT_5514 [Thermomyces lanuginosus]|uniref:uncharacterized protein n=1 Tax=Thermomyces lanuginosus TaxID=5541 RepID=UPI003742E892